MLLLTFAAVSGLGSEFLPHLEEGNLWIRATMPQSVSPEESDDRLGCMRKVMLVYPEVQKVISA